MSLIHRYRLIKGDTVVRSEALNTGYESFSDTKDALFKLIQDIDLKNNFIIQNGGVALPKFDKVTLDASTVTGVISIDLHGSGFDYLFASRQLQRSGTDAGTIAKLAKDHVVALAALDRSGYGPEEDAEYESAWIVANYTAYVFASETEVQGEPV